MSRIAITPDLVQWARERAGLPVDALASRFPKLPAWERGEAQPTMRQLEAFAKATHVPIGWGIKLTQQTAHFDRLVWASAAARESRKPLRGHGFGRLDGFANTRLAAERAEVT